MKLEICARWIAWLIVCAVAVFTLSPIDYRPVTAAPVGLERFAAFAVIGAAFCLGYPEHRLRVLVLLIGIAGFLELAQNLVPGRHGRLPDGLVKISGALLGAAFAVVASRGKHAS
jgi:VanZ family protein